MTIRAKNRIQFFSWTRGHGFFDDTPLSPMKKWPHIEGFSSLDKIGPVCAKSESKLPGTLEARTRQAGVIVNLLAEKRSTRRKTKWQMSAKRN